MGGPCNFAFRNTKGEVLFFEAYTGGMKWMVEHPGLIAKDEKYIPEIVKENKYLKFRTKSLYPDGYGLTVVDFITNKVYTMQNYSHFNEVIPFSVYNDSTQGDIENSLAAKLFKFIEMRRLRLITKRKSVKGNIHTVNRGILECNTLQDFIDLSKKLWLKKDYNYWFQFIYDPVEIQVFDNPDNNAIEFKNVLVTSGFEINETKWDDFFQTI